MAVLESRDYQAARERLKGNPVIAMMAAGVVAVPLAELAGEDGTPRSRLMHQANHAFDDAQARNKANPAYQPYPPDAHRHLGLIADGLPTDDIKPDERHALAERSTTRCEPLQSAAPSPGAILRSSAGSSGRAAG